MFSFDGWRLSCSLDVLYGGLLILISKFQFFILKNIKNFFQLYILIRIGIQLWSEILLFSNQVPVHIFSFAFPKMLPTVFWSLNFHAGSCLPCQNCAKPLQTGPSRRIRRLGSGIKNTSVGDPWHFGGDPWHFVADPPLTKD